VKHSNSREDREGTRVRKTDGKMKSKEGRMEKRKEDRGIKGGKEDGRKREVQLFYYLQ